MNQPDFFIVGAPKCGTTALHTYLGEHDEVFVCSPKEPNYFATDFPTQRYVEELDDYLALFRTVHPGIRARGEASAWYLYSRDALANIREFNPDAKIIAMVRNPLEMVPSLHRMLMINFAEDAEDLETAWELQEKRRAGECLPQNRNQRFDVATLQYSEVCKLGFQIRRLLDHFPAHQVLVITFDDFVHNTQDTYQQTLEFLGLSQDGRTGFPPVNVRRDFRSRRIARMVWRVRDFGTTVKRRMGITRSFGVQEILNRFNERQEPRPELADSFRLRLCDEFRDDVDDLATLIDRDLGHWLLPVSHTTGHHRNP